MLQQLCGQNWGQYGDIAFFLQGAYCDANGSLKTFKYISSHSIQLLGKLIHATLLQHLCLG